MPTGQSHTHTQTQTKYIGQSSLLAKFAGSNSFVRPLLKFNERMHIVYLVVFCPLNWRRRRRRRQFCWPPAADISYWLFRYLLASVLLRGQTRQAVLRLLHAAAFASSSSAAVIIIVIIIITIVHHTLVDLDDSSSSSTTTTVTSMLGVRCSTGGDVAGDVE